MLVLIVKGKLCVSKVVSKLKIRGYVFRKAMFRVIDIRK